MKKYDIAVIGGGFAGVAAALAAAREGARVIIIEKSNCLGGAAVNCLGQSLHALFYLESITTL